MVFMAMVRKWAWVGYNWLIINGEIHYAYLIVSKIKYSELEIN